MFQSATSRGAPAILEVLVETQVLHHQDSFNAVECGMLVNSAASQRPSLANAIDALRAADNDPTQHSAACERSFWSLLCSAQCIAKFDALHRACRAQLACSGACTPGRAHLSVEAHAGKDSAKDGITAACTCSRSNSLHSARTRQASMQQDFSDKRFDKDNAMMAHSRR